MLIKLVSAFHLALSLGAFFTGISMLPGMGIFVEFPPEWVGVMPFSSWTALAVFGMIVFGVGNAIAAIYGFTKKDPKLYLLAISLGLLLFCSAAMPIVLLGEWYLPLIYFFALSFMQISFGLFGMFSKYKASSSRSSIH
ncbi:MAG: hypothetical protein ACQEV0_11925 [Bacillota bacterium]